MNGHDQFLVRLFVVVDAMLFLLLLLILLLLLAVVVSITLFGLGSEYFRRIPPA